MLMKTPSDKSCMVRCMAWEMDRLKVIKYSSSSTACCVLSDALSLSVRSVFKCVTIMSCTCHHNSPAAWLHITDCSLKECSQYRKVFWLIVREAGAEGKLRLAILLNALFSLASSGGQEHAVYLSESFLSVCISYHLEGLGVFTNWSLSRPLVSAVKKGLFTGDNFCRLQHRFNGNCKRLCKYHSFQPCKAFSPLVV